MDSDPQAEERPTRHPRRRGAAQAQPRRIAADHQHPQGDMSLVGPRPVVRDELEIYGSAAVYYLKSRPGLTGLWQVSGRNDVSYDSRVAFDRHYVENWSFVFDLKILILTFPAVFSSRGSY